MKGMVKVLGLWLGVAVLACQAVEAGDVQELRIFTYESYAGGELQGYYVDIEVEGAGFDGMSFNAPGSPQIHLTLDVGGMNPPLTLHSRSCATISRWANTYFPFFS